VLIGELGRNVTTGAKGPAVSHSSNTYSRSPRNCVSR